jgi:pimeloyl-ACP methyl ester carboxylesterase
VKKWLPRLISIVSNLSARLGERLAWFLWFHPHGRHATKYPDGAEPLTVEVLGHKLRGFRIGQGPVVVLIHGWGGASTDMAPLAVAAAHAGYQAVVPDLPGHGSDRSSFTDVFRMAAAVDAVVAEFGPPRAVVAHSFGAVVAFAAFQHGGVDRVVLVAPAIKGERYVEEFRIQTGLADPAYRRFRKRFTAYAGPHLMNVFSGGGRVPGAEMLILHDPDDRSTSFEDVAEYASVHPGTHLVEVPGTGHKGILRDRQSREQTVAFIETGRVRPAISAADAAM